MMMLTNFSVDSLLGVLEAGSLWLLVCVAARLMCVESISGTVIELRFREESGARACGEGKRG